MKSKKALHGLAIYFAVLVPFSILFETLMITGDLSWYWALMWTPAFASVVARLIMREGFADVSFRINGTVWKGIGFAVIFPIIICVIAYGIAWGAQLVPFHPEPIWGVTKDASPIVILLCNLVIAATVVTLYSIRTAAGEEIGWRGYMLTRLIDAGVPFPILMSGLIWSIWHVPLIFGGVYLTGVPPSIAATLWVIMGTAFSFIFARLRLETGSVWPPVVLHAAWNSVIQVVFDPASAGKGSEFWVGESGIIVTITMVIAAISSVKRRYENAL